MDLQQISDLIGVIIGILHISPLIIIAYALAIKIVKELTKKRRE